MGGKLVMEYCFCKCVLYLDDGEGLSASGCQQQWQPLCPIATNSAASRSPKPGSAAVDEKWAWRGGVEPSALPFEGGRELCHPWEGAPGREEWPSCPSSGHGQMG